MIHVKARYQAHSKSLQIFSSIISLKNVFKGASILGEFDTHCHRTLKAELFHVHILAFVFVNVIRRASVVHGQN